jgi:glycosyltransferase involved in cell wall biosynthesis
MKGRVVLLITGLDRGGAESEVAQLAVELVHRGWEASVVSLAAPGVLAADLARGGVPVFSALMAPGRANPFRAARLLGLMRRLRPHVVHAHLFHANMAARLLRLLSPVPVVLSTIHSLAESPRGSAAIAARDRLYRLTGRLSDLTVCVCQASAERHVGARAVSPSRVRVIPNGVDTRRFRPDAAARERTRRMLAPADEFLWLAVGRLIWKKDYPAMLRAMARLGGGVLLVAGAGPLESELRSLAGELGVDARFLGARDDIPELMNAADGLVLSSVTEGLPLVLLEAAAAGLPALATDAGGAAEAVLDGRTGWVVPSGDIAALAAAMARLRALAPAERAAMGRAAREHAEARFDLRAVAGEWERLYQELLASAARRGLEWT